MTAATDDAGERFYRLVLADVNGTASDAEADSLRADYETAREWSAVLVRMTQDIDAELLRIKSGLAEKHAAVAQRRIPSRVYQDAVTKATADRAGLARQKAKIVERLREARDLGRITDEESGATLHVHERLSRIEAQLAEVLTLLRGGAR